MRGELLRFSEGEGELEQVNTVWATLIVTDSDIDMLGFVERQPEGLKELANSTFASAWNNDILMIQQKKK